MSRLGSYIKISGIFYCALVQDVHIYGLDIWVIIALSIVGTLSESICGVFCSNIKDATRYIAGGVSGKICTLWNS